MSDYATQENPKNVIHEALQEVMDGFEGKDAPLHFDDVQDALQERLGDAWDVRVVPGAKSGLLEVVVFPRVDPYVFTVHVGEGLEDWSIASRAMPWEPILLPLCGLPFILLTAFLAEGSVWMTTGAALAFYVAWRILFWVLSKLHVHVM